MEAVHPDEAGAFLYALKSYFLVWMNAMTPTLRVRLAPWSVFGVDKNCTKVLLLEAHLMR